MTVTQKTLIGTIDLTPTWSEILGTLLMVYENGNTTGRAAALKELQRMAGMADKYVAKQEKK